jgi:hypothetical protein
LFVCFPSSSVLSSPAPVTADTVCLLLAKTPVPQCSLSLSLSLSACSALCCPFALLACMHVALLRLTDALRSLFSLFLFALSLRFCPFLLLAAALPFFFLVSGLHAHGHRRRNPHARCMHVCLLSVLCGSSLLAFLKPRPVATFKDTCCASSILITIECANPLAFHAFPQASTLRNCSGLRKK